MNRFEHRSEIQACAVKVLDILTHARGHPPGPELSLEAAQMSSQARHLRQCLDGVERFIHLALAHFVSDHNDLGAGVAGVELHDRLDRHVALAEAAAHVADHARGVFCLETHIVALANVA